MKEADYLTIQGWMRTTLNLKGNELLVYALIYGFSKDEKSWFQGSANYIAEWVGITRQNVMKVLKKLVEKELIIKQEKNINGVKLVDYQANSKKVPNNTPCNETRQGGCNKTAHQSSISENFKESVSNDTPKKVTRFVKPTVEEVREYCRQRGNNIDAEQFIDYYESKGWLVGKAPMKDWKACIRTWERNGYGNAGTNKRKNDPFNLPRSICNDPSAFHPNADGGFTI